MKPRVTFDATSIKNCLEHDIGAESLGTAIADICKIVFSRVNDSNFPTINISVTIDEGNHHDLVCGDLPPVIKLDGKEYGRGETEYSLENVGYLFATILSILFREKSHGKFEPINIKITRKSN